MNNCALFIVYEDSIQTFVFAVLEIFTLYSLFLVCKEYILFVNQYDIKLENLKESPAKVHFAIESLLRGDVSNHKQWHRYCLALSVHF